VDGYNVMMAGAPPEPEDGPDDFGKRREEFLTKCRRVKEAVTVFFDASKAPPGSWGEVEGRGKLEVVFVRQGTADDAMVEWLKRHPEPHGVCVVTNDRELAGRARAMRAKSAGVEEFLKRLDPERLEGIEKPRITRDEARKWAETFGIDPDQRI
jgi:hypothetical protein